MTLKIGSDAERASITPRAPFAVRRRCVDVPSQQGAPQAFPYRRFRPRRDRILVPGLALPGQGFHFERRRARVQLAADPPTGLQQST